MASEQETAERAVRWMLERDGFSRWCGMELVLLKPGTAHVKMTVRKEMMNGFNVAHGGICYSLADSALAFAANSRGRLAVGLENAIRYPEAVKEGDEIVAKAEEEHCGNKIGHYSVRVEKKDGEKKDGTLVALFTGTVYRTSKAVGE